MNDDWQLCVYAPYLSDQTAILSAVRDETPFFGEAIDKLLAKHR